MKHLCIILCVAIQSSRLIAQCGCCVCPVGFSGGESTPNAFVLAKRQWLIEVYSDFRFYKPLVVASDHSSHYISSATSSISKMVIGSIGVRYGIGSKTTLLVQQPTFLIHSAATHRKAIGDLMIVVNQLLWTKNNNAFSLQTGVELPTGRNLQIANSFVISPGSGSFDPVIGMSYLWQNNKSIIGVSNSFKYATKGFDDTFFGNFFGQQLNYSYKLINLEADCLNDSLRKVKKTSLLLISQVSSEWVFPQLKKNVYVENTGSYLIVGSLGCSIGIKTVSIPILVTLPVYQHVNGSQNLTNYRVRIGITKTFK